MSIQFLGMDLLPNASNWLTIISTFANLLMSLVSLYGITVILPNFVKQKRVEHLSDNAKQGLDVLIEVEEGLKRLFFAVKVHLDAATQSQLQVEVSFALNKLRNILLLIIKNAEIPENFIREENLKKIEHWVAVLNDKTPYFPLKSEDILVVLDKNWRTNVKLDLWQLEELRDILVKIHGLNDRTPRG